MTWFMVKAKENRTSIIDKVCHEYTSNDEGDLRSWRPQDITPPNYKKLPLLRYNAPRHELRTV